MKANLITLETAEAKLREQLARVPERSFESMLHWPNHPVSQKWSLALADWQHKANTFEVLRRRKLDGEFPILPIRELTNSQLAGALTLSHIWLSVCTCPASEQFVASLHSVFIGAACERLKDSDRTNPSDDFEIDNEWQA